jgi:hypothetical protein
MKPVGDRRHVLRDVVELDDTERLIGADGS